jgi:hypothetical protein
VGVNTDCTVFLEMDRSGVCVTAWPIREIEVRSIIYDVHLGRLTESLRREISSVQVSLSGNITEGRRVRLGGTALCAAG